MTLNLIQRIGLLIVLWGLWNTPCVIASEKVQPIVSINWLLQAASDNAPNLVIVDVRGTPMYNAEHITGAIHLPAETGFNQAGDRTRIAPLNQIQDALSKAGIHNDDHIVFYDDGKLKSAAYLFWVMETYGHTKVSVLDGGLPGWKKRNGPTSTQAAVRPHSRYLPHIIPHLLSTKLTTRLATQDKRMAIIDSRVEPEFSGKISKSIRRGHIPGAINIPWEQNLDKSGDVTQLKSVSQLREMYRDVHDTKHVITYCNRGQESALTYLVLRSLGHPVSIYDGAWLEWAQDENLPIADSKTGAIRNTKQ